MKQLNGFPSILGGRIGWSDMQVNVHRASQDLPRTVKLFCLGTKPPFVQHGCFERTCFIEDMVHSHCLPHQHREQHSLVFTAQLCSSSRCFALLCSYNSVKLGTEG